MMSDIFRVFVSSTWLDLQPERKAAEMALQRMRETKLIGMEYSGSREDNTRDVSLADVDRSDFYIGIFGARYGSGITEDEYRRARERDIPCRIYFKAESTITDDQREKDPANAEKLAALKAELRRHHTVSEFDNTDNLAWRVTADLHDWLVETTRAKRAELIPVDLSRIIKYAPAELVGRESETALLDKAWSQIVADEKQRSHLLTFVALGGEGKTSLVAKWAAELAHQDWPECDAVFAWSFYSQGTREQIAASSDLFLREALLFFGDVAMADSAQSAHDKGRRLAQLVGERRALLILDGLEPLQYAPTSPTPGELRDQGLAALLTGLAASSRGLCVVTTRYSIPDLRAYWQTTAPEIPLLRLSNAAGVDLLQSLGLRGTAREFEALVEEVKGHALTLNLLGSYLRDAHGGDIRRRDLVKLQEADAEEQGGHAFRVMEAYERQFEREGDKGQRALAVLRLLGLFDRPATADCLEALWTGEVIAGLTEPLVGSSDAQRNIALKRLEDARLLTVNRDSSSTLVSLDAHPLLREYFAKQLQASPFRAAHRRLYEHLCASTQEGDQPTLEALQRLYQAVAHGCQAGLQQEACEKVYRDRISQGSEAYVVKKLGAFGSDLGAVACFFETPWSLVSPTLIEPAQAWLLGQAAFRLRALGRLTEALEPMRAGLEMGVKQEAWEECARHASNLSELELTLGAVAEAAGDAEQSVTYADRSGDEFVREATRTAHADALHQAGRRAEAEASFREAEQMQAERQPVYPMLYSLQGFQYCDLLLAAPERAAWRVVHAKAQRREESLSGFAPSREILDGVRDVQQRAAQTLKWAGQNDLSLVTIALDHLTLGRAALYEAILGQSEISSSESEIEQAVSGLRRAGTTHHIPRGLLTRAWQRFLTGVLTGPESAQRDLDEAWEIAARGPMKLHMADVLLYRARLFGVAEKGRQGEGERGRRGEADSENFCLSPPLLVSPSPYPWDSPEADLAAAEKLINDCGYHRRDEELADAKLAILGSPK